MRFQWNLQPLLRNAKKANRTVLYHIEIINRQVKI